MKGYFLLLFLFLVAFTKAQDKAIVYVESYKDIAIAEMQRTGVPAAITLAQGLVESGCGEGDLCKKSNNHFGIKCKNDWVGDRVYHDDDYKSECFRSYSSGADSYKDHSDFLRNRPNYAELFKLDPVDYEAWAKGLKKAGYATEKDYPQKLIKVINDYNLNQFSLMALHKNGSIGKSNSMVSASTDTLSFIDSTKQKNILAKLIPTKDSNSSTSFDTSMAHAEVKDTILGEMIISVAKNKETKQIVFTPTEKNEDSVTIINPNFNDPLAHDSSRLHYPAGIFVINHSKVIFVQEGISLLSIANQYNISLASLLEFNDMTEEDVTSRAQLIYLEQKQGKGSNDIHIVAKNETLIDISQKEGVRLERLLVYNKLKKDSILKLGDKVLLHPPVIMKSMVIKKSV